MDVDIKILAKNISENNYCNDYKVTVATFLGSTVLSDYCELTVALFGHFFKKHLRNAFLATSLSVDQDWKIEKKRTGATEKIYDSYVRPLIAANWIKVMDTKNDMAEKMHHIHSEHDDRDFRILPVDINSFNLMLHILKCPFSIKGSYMFIFTELGICVRQLYLDVGLSIDIFNNKNSFQLCRDFMNTIPKKYFEIRYHV